MRQAEKERKKDTRIPIYTAPKQNERRKKERCGGAGTEREVLKPAGLGVARGAIGF